MSSLGDAVVDLGARSGSFPGVAIRTFGQVSSASISSYFHPGTPESIQILQSDPFRVAFLVANSGSSVALLGYGFRPSLSGAYTRVVSNNQAAVSAQIDPTSLVYTGNVWMIWNSGTLSGSVAYVTEFFA